MRKLIVLMVLFAAMSAACGSGGKASNADRGPGAGEPEPVKAVASSAPQAEESAAVTDPAEAGEVACGDLLTEKDVEGVFGFDVVPAGLEGQCKWRKPGESTEGLYWEFNLGVNPFHSPDLDHLRDAVGVDEELSDIPAEDAFRSGTYVNILKSGQHVQIMWLPATADWDESLLREISVMVAERM